jgi:hypothetical protein
LVADAGGLPPEAMEPLTIVDEGLQALHSWLELIWPYLLLPPLFRWAWVSVRDRLGSLWDLALEHPLGGLWPAPAAILPAFIPFARDWDQSAPIGTKRFTVAALLLAVAVLQIYGQQRNNRDRIKTENRFTGLFREVWRARRTIIRARRESSRRSSRTTARLVDLLGTIEATSSASQRRLADLIAEIEAGRESTRVHFMALFDEIEAARIESETISSGIADAITALAATAEEAQRD